MAVSIPRGVVERVLLGRLGDRRQLQDSPVLGDVWIEFAARPDQLCDLLITPSKTQAAGSLAVKIDERVKRKRGQPGPNVAYLQNVVAARLFFGEVLSVVVPMTEWWSKNKGELDKYAAADAARTEQSSAIDAAEKVNTAIDVILDAARGQEPAAGKTAPDIVPAFDRYIALAGLILWAGAARRPKLPASATTEEIFAEALKGVSKVTIADLLLDLLDQINDAPKQDRAMVWQVALNREVRPAIARSVASAKADAARFLFKVDCSQIAWAVLDSGINGRHPAFLDRNGQSRVRRCFDFSSIRNIISLDNLRNQSKRKERAAALLQSNLVHPPDQAAAEDALARLAKDAAEDRAIDWQLVQPFVELKVDTEPLPSNHGTHVAGILCARRADAPANNAGAPADDDVADGMCPEISLYDFRILGEGMKESEFAVIAALQFIRYLNARTSVTVIHGANLSLSIPHDVRNYACGWTPVCTECERLVDSGVVVVAAAGNRGYHSFQTKEGEFESYAAFSITDPGNADGVITVGATHRYAPHTYGVSFFSSRGPTGDGRLKPDLVAPGERIRAPFRDGTWGDLDGTSMAAPHVSGAAAMLMARYPELIGQPRRIKSILCKSATDLGRERSFQGHGMLDVLRAFQSV